MSEGASTAEQGTRIGDMGVNQMSGKSKNSGNLDNDSRSKENDDSEMMKEGNSKRDDKIGKDARKTTDMDETPYTVILKKVIKKYGDGENEVTALKGVNLPLAKGSISAIMGPSGSGKSTLINLIGSLDVPTTGEVIVDGVNLEDMTSKELTDYRREKVGFVFQTFNLLPNLNALENVELPMEFQGIPANERSERAKKLLKAVKLEHRATHLPGALSSGEKQRVAIARALANNPSIILADEPTGNLDSKSGKKVIDLLKALAKNRNKTLIIVTHDQKIAEMTDRIISLEDGRIEEIRDVGDTNILYHLSRELDIPSHLMEMLFEMGFDDLDKILQVTEANLMGKHVQKKDKRLIMNRIKRYRSVVRQNICFDCNKEIPLQGITFCPFCGKAL